MSRAPAQSAHRRSRLVRGAGLVLTAVALLSQLSGFVHLALKPHGQCAEHGDLVELRDVRETHLAGRPSAAAHVANAAEASHGHDHCLLSPLGRDRALPDCAFRAVSFVALAPALFAPPTLAAPRSTRLLFRLAPKNSPPA